MKVLSALGSNRRIFRLREYRLDSLFEDPLNERPEGAICFTMGICNKVL